MSSNGRTVRTYLKAIVGFLAPGIVAIGGALTVNSDGGGEITQYEWVAAVIACLVTGGFVYATPNQPYIKTEQDPAMADPAPDPAPDLRRGELGHPDHLQPRPVTRYEDDIDPH
jgi:hypothetical protein